MTAEIAKKSDSINQVITFNTSSGSFVGGTATSQTERAESGLAEARVNVGTEPGIFLLKASVGTGIVYEAKAFLELIEVDADQAMEVSFTNLNTAPLRADDFSQVQITVQAQGINFNNKKVTLDVTGGGVFSSNSDNDIVLDFDNSGKASTILKVGQVETDYSISFTLSDPNIKTIKTLPLLRANPERVIIDPAGFSIAQTNGMVSLTTYLTRNIGKVSTQTPVNYSATQVQNGQEVQVGNFSPPIIRSGTNEQAAVVFRTFPTAQVSMDTTIKIMVTAIDDSGALVKDSSYLQVQ